jgi:hypothetical protein
MIDRERFVQGRAEDAQIAVMVTCVMGQPTRLLGNRPPLMGAPGIEPGTSRV